ncbi:MAG: hypothetical protein H0T54_03730, partial [Geodermatophilaceae bacterium]|nr:hypothetical protein [Geodermatophilaceae bacterium]
MLGALCLAPALAMAQGVSGVQAGVALERDTVVVGQVVQLTIRVRAPRGSTIGFPAAVDSLGPVQSLEPPIVRDGADSASADRIAVYRLAAWDVGRLDIRLGAVVVQSAAGEQQLAVPLPTLFVRSVLPIDTTKRVPKPPRALLFAPAGSPWWWWLIAAAVAVGLLFLAWWWRRRRMTIGESGDPFADAQAQFARVDALGLLDAGEHGQYAALMTVVARRYLSARVPSMSMAHTSDELLRAAADSPVVPRDGLRALVEEVDPVKFAHAPITRDRAEAAGARARALVQETHDRAGAADAARAAHVPGAAVD